MKDEGLLRWTQILVSQMSYQTDSFLAVCDKRILSATRK